jgi:diaminopimelate decarboxylase
VGEGVLTGSEQPERSAGAGVDGRGALVPGFPRVGGVLHCRTLSLETLARRFGTPLYVYDQAGIATRVRAFQAAFAGVDFLLAFSVKANGNLAVLNRIGAMGAGADIVSGGELYRALRAGIPPSRIVFAGVAKTEGEMQAALEAGIYAFHVESAGELELLEQVAGRLGVKAPVGIRVNPDVESPTPHEYTRTGHAGSKFGVPPGEALELYRSARRRSHLRVLGVDVHIGSQIVDVEPYLQALDTVLHLVDILKAEGQGLEYVDLGGGFGVGYDGEPGLDLDALADRVVRAVRSRNLRLILEPGRSVVGHAGVLLTRVRYVKRSRKKTFVVTDGGMTELLRPSHYGGWHRIEPVTARPDSRPAVVDVVGPVCETGDFLARDREVPLPEPGDLLAVGTAGAYGFTMASNYNARLRPAEILVEDGRALLVRPRETLEDLVRGEEIPPRPS